MEVELPDDFRCPISLEVMTDPVILTSGHTFDRASIQRWLDSGNRTCPVTNLPLPPSPSLIPNHALRRLILSHSPSLSLPSANLQPCLSSSPPDPLSLVSSPHSLSSFYCYVKSSSQFRHRATESGAVTVLLGHVVSPGESREVALRALLRLSLDGDDTRVGLVADGAVDALAVVLSQGGSTPSAAAVAATVLTSLAMVDVNKCTIGAHPSVFPALSWLLSKGADRQCMREAATALYELCKFPANRRRAVRAGLVPALVKFGMAGSERAIEVLGQLAKNQEGKAEMRKVESLVRWLVSVARTGSARGTDNALLVLNLVCSDCEDMSMEAVKEGALDVSLSLIESDEGKIAKNAASLVRTLQDFQLGCFR
ncbi:U-box domain-containing protein [Rhynchospora pubera]|uniref:RING-type E3 ubiquitin transferase n=1 Tax=Rhynchospora pubera TaxID=906938 RepID=A0AAV8G2X8_9POAL|nr:U-box domain-containing protein [Rhynchospora pubera]KAJ4798625.1 U-box domain-containing protein [Rhynchospora pubera]